MKELVGTVVKSVFVDEAEQHYMLFKTDLFDCAFRADGYVCSESWFYAVTGLSRLIDEKVYETVEVLYNVPVSGKTRSDYDILSRISLVTNRGACDVFFRNNHDEQGTGFIKCVGSKVPDYVTMTKIEEDYTV